MKSFESNSIEFTPVSIEDAAKTSSPALSPKALDDKYSVEKVPTLKNISSEVIKDTKDPTPSLQKRNESISPEDTLIIEKAANLANLMTQDKQAIEFGKSIGIDARPRYEGDGADPKMLIANKLSMDKWGGQQGKPALVLGSIGTTAATFVATLAIPQIAVAGGLTYLASLPLVTLAAMSIPVLFGVAAVGMTGYFGFKTIKNLRERSLFKKAFGKKVKDVYPNDKYY